MLKKTLISGLTVAILVFVGNLWAGHPDNSRKPNNPGYHKQMQKRDGSCNKQEVGGIGKLLAELDKAYRQGDMKRMGRIIGKMKHKLHQKVDSEQRYGKYEARKSGRKARSRERRGHKSGAMRKPEIIRDKDKYVPCPERWRDRKTRKFEERKRYRYERGRSSGMSYGKRGCEPERKAGRFGERRYHRRFGKRNYGECPHYGSAGGFDRECYRRNFEKGYRNCPGRGYQRRYGHPERKRGFDRGRKFGRFESSQGYKHKGFRRSQKQSEGFPWGW